MLTEIVSLSSPYFCITNQCFQNWEYALLINKNLNIFVTMRIDMIDAVRWLHGPLCSFGYRLWNFLFIGHLVEKVTFEHGKLFAVPWFSPPDNCNRAEIKLL